MRKAICMLGVKALFPHILLAIIFAFCNYLETTGQSSQSPSVAILITHSGDTNSVTDLFVKYRQDVSGGKLPLRYEWPLTKSFHLLIRGTQGGAKWTNAIEIPFEKIRRITFAPIVGGRYLTLDELKSRGLELLVEKRDGSSISIKQLNVNTSLGESYIYEETDPAGEMIKSFRFDGLSYSYREAVPTGYIGHITTPFGEEGSFEIGSEKVRSIEFK